MGFFHGNPLERLSHGANMVRWLNLADLIITLEIFWRSLKRLREAFTIYQHTESLISSCSSESLSISPTTLSPQSPHVDGVCERTLIDRIPSPTVATWNSIRKVHILSLRHAVRFGTFLDISDTDLCHSTVPNGSLSSLSVCSSIVEQFDAKKHSAQVEGQKSEGSNNEPVIQQGHRFYSPSV